MQMKSIEIRDHRTFIPAMAIKLHPENESEQYNVLLMLLVRMDGTACANDPHSWPSPRTMSVAHAWLEQHFDEVKDGDVIDVQFIIGETQEPKKSERDENHI